MQLRENFLRSALGRVSLAVAVALGAAGCDQENRAQNRGNFCAGGEFLTQADVDQIILQAVSQARAMGVIATIAVTDREGEVLGVFNMSNGALTPGGPLDVNGDGTAGDALDNIREPNIQFAISKAGTASFFQSEEECFTTRTAFFIVQGHYPPGVRNAPAGPLFGVQDSSLTSSDNKPMAWEDPDGDGLANATATGISGEFGGVPLYKNGCPVGGVGIDVVDRLRFVNSAGQITDDPADPDSAITLLSPIQNDTDEILGLAAGTRFFPPRPILAFNVYVDGIGFPFADTFVRDLADPLVEDTNLDGLTIDQLTAAGHGALDGRYPIRSFNPASDDPIPFANASGRASPLPPEGRVVGGTQLGAGQYGIRTRQRFVGRDVSRFDPDFLADGSGPGAFTNIDRPPTVTFDTTEFRREGVPIVPLANQIVGGIPGEVRFPFIDSIEPPPAEGGLTAAEVQQVIAQAVRRAEDDIAGIRLPRGVGVTVHAAVIDTRGNILGIFRMGDGTIFSFDVAVQKARTCAFFSTGRANGLGDSGLPTVAISPRGIGFIAQPFFPPGLDGTEPGALVRIRDLINRGKITVENPPSLTLLNPPPRLPSDGNTDENILRGGNQLFDDYPGASPTGLAMIRQVLNLAGGAPPFTGGVHPLMDRPDVGFVSPGLQNGLQTFPGGFPLYKLDSNGVKRLVGAIGISGDGVDEDDSAAFGGTVGFDAPNGARIDEQSDDSIIAVINARFDLLVDAIAAHPDARIREVYLPLFQAEQARIAFAMRDNRKFEGVRLPYVKFARNRAER
jgi:uncharacterized protein GlcG (DUF336 family)